jgi:putative endonuclease
MPFVYMLECEDASYYVGSTVLLEERVQQHQLGLGAESTRCRRPVRLVWFEEYEDIAAAFARAKQVQSWGRAKRRALIEGRYADLPVLARRRGPSGPSPGGTD